MKTTKHILIMAAAAVVAVSCQKESPFQTADESDAVVRFMPGIAAISGADVTSKSTVQSANLTGLTLSSEDGSFTLPMSCEVSEGIFTGTAGQQASAHDTLPNATKGALINEDGSGEAFDTSKSFFVTAFDNATSANVIPGTAGTYQEVKMKGTQWNTVQTISSVEYSQEYLWKKDETKTFYAYANLPAATGAASVACTAATGQALSYDVTKVTDASAQTDILLGYYSGNGKTGPSGSEKMTGTASIVFSHPLTAVKFSLGTIIGASSFAVNSISIEGVYASGKAEMTPTSAAETDPKDRFAWTKTDGSAFTAGDATATVSQTIATQPTTSEPAIGEAFLLIPQTFASNATSRIAIACTMDGESRTLYWPLASAVWKAGYTNTYTIGFDGNTYTFELSTPSQANLTFNNTTTASSPQTINLTSKAQSLGGAISNAEWLIKSVQVGSADPTPVGDISFEGIGGISASQTDGGTKLSITAASRSKGTPGSHEYWTGSNGGWSPEDWSTTKATSSSPLDLSKFDPYADTPNAHEMTTANCYIIRHAGTYKLPLVYGNAIVNGDTNEQSYAPTIAAEGTNGLTPFVNSTGAGITSPFIENNQNCGGSDLKCAVIWQDKDTVVRSLQIVEGASAGTADSYTKDNVRYLQFSIAQEDIRQNNALICVYKDKEGGTANKYDSGEAVWSWHIWTTNNPALLSPAIRVTNFTDNKYDFFPLYTLGWIDPESYPSRSDVKIVLQQKKSGNEIEIAVTQPSVATATAVARGCRYQFGRKDPMPPTDVTGFTINSTKTTASLSAAITNPNVFYKVSSGDWCSTPYYNLWTGKKSTTGTIDQAADMIKTIYDPSPVGYKMPASNAFTGFTTTGENVESGAPTNCNVSGSFDKGWYFYTVKYSAKTESTPTIFFPAAGFRYYVDGRVLYVGAYGYYWSAVPYDAGDAYSLNFLSSHVGPVSHDRRANGFSVRPVQE